MPLPLVPLRVLLAAGIGLCIAAQTVVLPVVSGWLADDEPAAAHLRWPLLTHAVLVLACGELTLVATWQLVGAVEHERIFDPRALRWVDLIVWASAGAVALSAAGLVYLAVAGIGPVGILAAAVLATLVLLGFLLLMLVLRALLRQATALRVELDCVI